MKTRPAFPAGAVALVASLGLASPALASSVGRAGAAPHPANGAFASHKLGSSIVTEPSDTFAGYQISEVDGPATVVTTFVVPKVKCTHKERAIAASVGMDVNTFSNYSDADVFIGCLNGKPTFFPALTINSFETNYKSVKLHPGDKVVLKAAVTGSHQTMSVADKTTGVTKSLTQTGGGGVAFPWVGEVDWYDPDQLRVPNFGQIAFSGTKVAHAPLGSYASGPGLERFNRYTNSSFTTLQIKTGKLNSTAFKSLFEHS